MLAIRREDTVILADYATGKVVEIITTEATKVYKIKKLVGDEIIYVEDKMVRLDKQCKKNLMLTVSMEVVNFLLYTLTCRL